MFDKTIENIKKCKEELRKRYCYIYENSSYILAPFVSKLETNDRSKIFAKINNLDEKTLFMLENLLLENISFKETEGYKYFESLKENKEYLERVKLGLEIADKYNSYMNLPTLKIKLNSFRIYEEVYNYINRQTNDLENKKRKLQVIDEYCRISRYENNGKVWTSGVKINFTDFKKYYLNIPSSMKDNINIFLRNQDDLGVKNNKFINCFANTSLTRKSNAVHFTEKEKQEIYLKYNDELPYYTYIICMRDRTDILRLEIPEPCNNEFRLEQSNIFTDGESFYQLCPYCNYIVKISNEILSENVKKKIIANSFKYNDKVNTFKEELEYRKILVKDNK